MEAQRCKMCGERHWDRVCPNPPKVARTKGLPSFVTNPIAKPQTEKINRSPMEAGTSCPECKRLKSALKKGQAELEALTGEVAQLKRQLAEANAKLVNSEAVNAKPVNRASVRVKANRARKDGRLQAQPCQKCGAVDVEMHHPDYSKALEVEWLCKPCHAKIHGKGPENRALYMAAYMRKRRAADKAKRKAEGALDFKG